MRRSLMIGVTLLAALGLAATACKKKDDNEAPAPKTTAPPKTEAPEPKELTADDKMKIFDECWAAADAKDVDKLAGCYTDDARIVMLDSVPPMEGTGPEGSKKLFGPFAAAFPDLKHTHGLVLLNGNKIANTFVMQGTNTGDLMGMPATNKEVKMWGAQVVELNDEGKVIRDVHVSDSGTLMTQLEVMPNPEAPLAADVEAPAETTRVVASEDGAKEKANVELLESMAEPMKAGEWDKVLAMYADDAVFRYVGGKKTYSGKEEITKGMGEWAGMHSEMTNDVSDIWGAGDWVVVESSTKGTLAKNFPGAPVKVKGKSYEANYVEFFRIADGKIAEHWIFPNSAKMMADIGLMDPSKMGGAAGKGDKKMDEKK